MYQSSPQEVVHKTIVPHPLSEHEEAPVCDWGSFPARHRTHISTMRARSAIVHRRYAWKDNDMDDSDMELAQRLGVPQGRKAGSKSVSSSSEVKRRQPSSAHFARYWSALSRCV